MTGVTLLSVEVGPKLLEMLRGAVPRSTIGLLVNQPIPIRDPVKNTQEAARSLGLELHVLNASTERDFDAVLQSCRLAAGALIIAQTYFQRECAQLAH